MTPVNSYNLSECTGKRNGGTCRSSWHTVTSDTFVHVTERREIGTSDHSKKRLELRVNWYWLYEQLSLGLLKFALSTSKFLKWFRSCSMWSCVVGRVIPDVSERRSAFIFSLRIKTVQSFETLRNTCLTAQSLIPKDLILQQHYCENLNSRVMAVCGVLALHCPCMYQ